MVDSGTASVTGNSETTVKEKVVGERRSESLALPHRLSFLNTPWKKGDLKTMDG